MVLLRALAVSGLAAIASGCVSIQQVPLAPATGTSLRDREIALGARDKPDFGAMRSSTMGILGGGLIAGAIMISEGNRIVAENGIEDPAGAIERALGANLEHAYGARLATRTAKLQDDEVAAAVRQNSGSDLILDVRTINWSIAYFATAWTRYRVMYRARLRLIDAKRSQVLAEGACSRIPEETPDAPTFDELVADGAARLKRELALAAEHCVRTFSTQTLSIATPAIGIAALSPSAAPAATIAPVRPAASTPGTAGPALAATLGTPMPDDLALAAPPADLPPALARFCGVWTTREWGLGGILRQHTLVVESVEGRNASLVYSLGPAGARAAQPNPTFSRVVGVFAADGSLHATLRSGTRLVYRISEDGRSLVGDWTQQARHFQSVLQRHEP